MPGRFEDVREVLEPTDFAAARPLGLQAALRLPCGTPGRPTVPIGRPVSTNDPPPPDWTPAAGTASADVMQLVLLLAALLLGAPAHAGDDALGSVAKQPSLWDRMKAIDRSMQHDAEHPESMGEEPGADEDDEEDEVKAPVKRPSVIDPVAPAPAPSRGMGPPPSAGAAAPAPAPGRQPATPPSRNVLESPIGRSPLAPEPPAPDDGQ
jgi:hypothetical protein